MIYWRKINISDWRIFNNSPILKSPNFIPRYLDTSIINGHSHKTHYNQIDTISMLQEARKRTREALRPVRQL